MEAPPFRSRTETPPPVLEDLIDPHFHRVASFLDPGGLAALARLSARLRAALGALWAQPGSRPLVDISRRTERRAPSLESLRAIARSGLFAVGGVSILTKPRTPGSPADQTVRVDATCITHEHLADALAQLPCLRQLKLRGATAEVFARALPALAPTLGSLVLRMCDDTDAVADALAASALAASARPPLGALTTLDFSFSNLTTVRAIAAAKLPSLRRLDLISCFRLGEEQRPASADAHERARRAREGAFTCVAALGALRELNVSYCPRLNEVDLTAISVSPSIVKLNCSNCPGLTSLAPLARMRALTTLCADDCSGLPLEADDTCIAGLRALLARRGGGVSCRRGDWADRR